MMTREEASNLQPGDFVRVADEFFKCPSEDLEPWLGKVVTVKRILRCSDGVIMVEIEEAEDSFYAEEIFPCSPPNIEDCFDEEIDIKLLFGGDG